MAASNDLVAKIAEPAVWIFASIGALYLSGKALTYFRFLLSVFALSGTNLRKYGKKGTWAVVTGASDGLGKEFATQLASKGFNLILVSRTQSKLQTLASELESKFGTLQIKILAMDFAADNDKDYERLSSAIEGLDVGILINNVGQSHSIPTPFLLGEKKEMQDIVTINCLGTLKVTHVIAPGMQSRKRGLILTMGSFGGWAPTPYLATYSGSKAFLQQWSSALAAELKPSNVDVQLCLSYLVTTAMSKVRRSSLLIPNAKSFVRSALGKVGSGSWQTMPSTYTPWWTHAVMGYAVETFLGTGSTLLRWYNLKMHQDIRTRALRKAARDAKKQ
ncbi:3-ketoacyl-CoA reductase [Xylariales sp. AK1849]|nr:3-ketoacyl-CoA reductase [Xylariales sp. AK1849]